MEMFATLLFLVSMLAGIIFIISIIIRKIKRKPKSKLYSRGLFISIIVFIVSNILYSEFQTPESKAKYEQQRLEQQQAKAQEEKEKAEQEAKELEEEQKEKEKAEQEAKKLEEEQKEKDKAELEAKKLEEEKMEQEKAAEIAKSQNTKKKSTETTEEQLRSSIVKVVGEDNFDTFNYVPDNNFALVKFKGSENITTNMTIKGMYMDISNILKEIQNKVDVNIDVNVTYPMQDAYGNPSENIVIKATFNNETIKKINFNNFSITNIPTIADEWWNHKAVTIN